MKTTVQDQFDWSSDEHRDLIGLLGDVALKAVRSLNREGTFGKHASKATRYTEQKFIATDPGIDCRSNFADDPNYMQQATHEAHYASMEALEAEAEHGIGAARTSDAFGGPQMWVDKHAKDKIHKMIRKIDPSIPVVGEEALDHEWSELSGLAEGRLAIVADVLDGSVLYQTTGTNWNVVLLLAQQVGDKLEVVGVVIADSKEQVFRGNLLTGELTVENREDKIDLADTRRELGAANPWTVASVAASGADRRRLEPLMRLKGGWGLRPLVHGSRIDWDPALSVVTVGGNPLLAHMALGGLGYVVQSRWTTVFDAAGFILLAMQPHNFEFYVLTSEPPFHTMKGARSRKVDAKDVLEMFNDIHSPQRRPNQKQEGRGTYKPIPAMVATRAGNHDLIGTGFPEDDPHYPDHTSGERVVDRIVSVMAHHLLNH